ncbi:MAG: UDP-glucose 4-epimerase GalE [Gammaproteobacteria bacterium]
MLTNKILVVGGAGYIGSHMTDYLQRSGLTPVVLDDLSTGHRDAVLNAELIVGTLADTNLLDEIFQTGQFVAVMHFASFIQVGESVKDPEKYYQNNVASTLNLLTAMLKHNVNKFIFSSTAAVYGEPNYTPIDENHPIAPINPYGHSKRMVEQVLADYMKAYGFHYAVLRYFNAAGADPAGKLHERHDPETHLIPLVLQVARGERDAITIYGRDYPTPDGTCVRDYIHVNDLCDAHLLALQSLENGVTSCTYNLGTGQGYSVQHVVEVAREVTGAAIPVIYGPRRSGDPAILVADAKRAMRELAWRPKYSDLKTIIQHAWGG